MNILGNKVPRSERTGTFSAWNFGQRAKVPSSKSSRDLLELLLPGAEVPGNEKARYPVGLAESKHIDMARRQRPVEYSTIASDYGTVRRIRFSSQPPPSLQRSGRLSV